MPADTAGSVAVRTPHPWPHAGGDQIRGFDWVLSRGGVAPNEAYPYKGVNDFCRETQELKFKGGGSSRGLEKFGP